MIPAPESELTKINIEGITDIAYKTLLQKQVQFIRKNQDNILKKHANVVYVNRKKGRMDIGYIKMQRQILSCLRQNVMSG